VTVDPRGADLKRCRQEDPGDAVVMLDLLRFAEGRRRELYARYAEALSSTFLADPEYQQVTALRTRALTEAVLQATSAW
jgi:hypothetical protein